MEQKLKLIVDGEREFFFSKKEIDALDIQELSSSRYHILKDQQSYHATLLSSDFQKKTYSVRVNSKTYQVSISNELDLLIEHMGMRLESAQVGNDIKAPMPGLILDVQVQEGQAVKEGDYLVVLEAMKMENTLTAPRDGVVKKLLVSRGETVDKNQLLIEME